jgi:hypothetical protein
MSKIKEIIEKMGMRGISYPDAQLLVAKRVWLIIVSLYYLSVLFTVGGFYFTISIPGIEPHTVSIAELSLIQFHFYSVLIIATAWFIYALVEYGVKVYFSIHRWFQITAGIILSIVTIGILLIHLGVIQTLLH